MSDLSELYRQFDRAHDLELKDGCERSLMAFTRYLWDITDPGQSLVPGWPMEAIAEHLEACHTGDIRRLLITVPPGFSKSSLCNVFFPLWVWVQEDDGRSQAFNRFIHASYEQGIPERDNLKARNIIGHEKFQGFWADRFKLVVPNQKDRFENDHTGWKMATAVGAKLIGHRGNYIIIDDPNDPGVENQSGLKRKQAVNWFRETVPTRLNNMATDKIVVIQQRLHMEDVAGVALGLEHENYTHLNIRMEYEPRAYVNGWNAEGEIETFYDVEAEKLDPQDVFWTDPRQFEGELAWPARFGPREVGKLKKTLGKTMVAAQLQQRPVPRGGNIIDFDSWRIMEGEKFPGFSFILATLDTAYTEDERNDPAGLTIWGLTHDQYQNPQVYLVYAWTDWLELTPLIRRVLHTCTRNDVLYDECVGMPRLPCDKLVIEGKASGLSVQQEIARLVSTGHARNLSVDILPARLLRDDKESRLRSVSHLFDPINGMIFRPDKAFADAVVDQVGNFPYATHDEFVDCTCMALRWLRDSGFTPTRDEVHEDKDAEMAFNPKPRPLYGGVD